MNFIYFIILLLVIVLIHEFGHLIAAKIFNVYCGEFSFGIGPLLFQKQWGETKYSFRLLPLGGYCAFAGETDDQDAGMDLPDNLPKERTFKGIHPLKRMVITYAGILMNVILALVISSGLFLYNGVYVEGPDNTIHEVNIDSPAELAGIESGDKITKVTIGKASFKIKDFEDLSYAFEYYEEGSITFEILKENGEQKEIDITPRYMEEEDRYVIGIVGGNNNFIDVNLGNCVKYGFIYLVDTFKMMIDSIAKLFRGIGLNNLSGPIGIYNVTSEVVKMGFMSYINLMAILSLNIGIVNALPLPVLDGGRALMILYEFITKKPINKKVENGLLTISLLLMLGLLLFSSYQDILKLFK